MMVLTTSRGVISDQDKTLARSAAKDVKRASNFSANAAWRVSDCVLMSLTTAIRLPVLNVQSWTAM